MLNRALRNLPMILTKVFKVVLKWQQYPPVWKHGRVISLLKLGYYQLIDPTVYLSQ